MIIPGTAAIRRCLGALGNPERTFPVIHISGTNGKGSTGAIIAETLAAAGIRTGHFHSPYLQHARESALINGTPARKHIFDTAWTDVTSADRDSLREAKGDSLGEAKGYDRPLTPFEILTAASLTTFCRERVDAAVVEVGAGGLEDCTNVFGSNVLASVITPIAKDHEALLGGSLEEIARHKAGIIQRDSDVIVALQPYKEEVTPVIWGAARSAHSRLWQVEAPGKVVGRENLVEVSTGRSLVEAPFALLGEHQLCNCATAALTIGVLQGKVPEFGLSDEHLRAGLRNVRWPGRMSWTQVPLKPHPIRVLVDGAHNYDGSVAVAKYVRTLERRPETLVCALTKGRDLARVLGPLLELGFARVRCVEYSPTGTHAEAVPAEELAGDIRALGIDAEAMSLEDALEEGCLVCGSLYLAGDVYRLCR